jgi:hypothetical protein
MFVNGGMSGDIRVQCLTLPILFAWNCSFGLSVR